MTPARTLTPRTLYRAQRASSGWFFVITRKHRPDAASAEVYRRRGTALRAARIWLRANGLDGFSVVARERRGAA